MAQLRSKGTNFRSFVSAFKRLRGEEAVNRALDYLNPELGGGLRAGAIVTGSWYPVAWYVELHAAAQKATGEGVELSREISRAGIRDDFSAGVYRLITVSISPQSIFKWAPRVVGLYWDGGRFVVEEAETGRAMGRFEGFVGFNRNLWEDMIGGSVGVMELAGAKHISVRVLSGGADGDPHMSYVVRWSA